MLYLRMNYIFLFLIRFSHSAWLDLIILTSSARLVLAIARTSARLAIAYALASAKPRTAPPVQDYRPGRPPLDTPHFRPHASPSLTLGHRRPHAPLRKSRPIALLLLRSTRRISDRTQRWRRQNKNSDSRYRSKLFYCPPTQRFFAIATKTLPIKASSLS